MWLAGVVTPEWAERYGRPVRYDRLPKGRPALDARMLQVGEDGMAVLNAVHDPGAPPRNATWTRCRSCGGSGDSTELSILAACSNVSTAQSPLRPPPNGSAISCASPACPWT